MLVQCIAGKSKVPKIIFWVPRGGAINGCLLASMSWWMGWGWRKTCHVYYMQLTRQKSKHLFMNCHYSQVVYNILIMASHQQWLKSTSLTKQISRSKYLLLILYINMSEYIERKIVKYKIIFCNQTSKSKQRSILVRDC